MKDKVITRELRYIEENFEFSDDCNIELRNYLIGNNLIQYYDGVLMLTGQGELSIGYTKTDLHDKYGDEDELNDNDMFTDDLWEGDYSNE